jgi:hypothetical protein
VGSCKDTHHELHEERDLLVSILELAQGGQSCYEIAIELGVSPAVIRFFLGRGASVFLDDVGFRDTLDIHLPRTRLFAGVQKKADYAHSLLHSNAITRTVKSVVRPIKLHGWLWPVIASLIIHALFQLLF